MGGGTFDPDVSEGRTTIEDISYNDDVNEDDGGDRSEGSVESHCWIPLGAL